MAVLDLKSARVVFALCALAVVAYLSVLGYTLQHGIALPGRLIADGVDRYVYYERARFWPDRSIPYRDVFSEYPPLGTLSFAAPFMVGDASKMTPERYGFWWSCFMGLAFLATIAVILRARQDGGLSPGPALLMLSPSILYFSLMRFDILCAFLVCASLYRFMQGSYSAAAALLALGVYVKWYPGVLFPLYLAHNLRSLHWSKTARHAGVFIGIIGLLTVLSLAAFTWDGFLQPYLYHARRGSQYFNPFWVGQRVFDDEPLALAFLAVQLASPLLFMLKIQHGDRSVLKYSVLTIYLFITFAKIDSPQWIVWYAPVVLMFARDRATLTFLFVTSLLNYVVFPLAYDAMDNQGLQFSSIVLAKDIALLAVVLCIVTRE